MVAIGQPSSKFDRRTSLGRKTGMLYPTFFVRSFSLQLPFVYVPVSSEELVKVRHRFSYTYTRKIDRATTTSLSSSLSSSFSSFSFFSSYTSSSLVSSASSTSFILSFTSLPSSPTFTSITRLARYTISLTTYSPNKQLRTRINSRVR